MNNAIELPLPEPLRSALAVISDRARSRRLTWLVGGSTGLMLQGVPLSSAPRDLDLYVDGDQAKRLHEALPDYSVDAQTKSETAIYRSILSHYAIAGVKVELVGGFVVQAMDSVYTVEAAYLAGQHAAELRLADGHIVKLMPLVHELVFNVLRGRPDRYEAIAEICRSKGAEGHKQVLAQLAARNRFSSVLSEQLWRLLSKPQ